MAVAAEVRKQLQNPSVTCFSQSTTNLQICPPWPAASSSGLGFALASPAVDLKLRPLDGMASLSVWLALDSGDMLPSARDRARPSWVGCVRFVVGSRCLKDVGLEGSSVLIGPPSRPSERIGDCDISLITLQTRDRLCQVEKGAWRKIPINNEDGVTQSWSDKKHTTC